MTTPKLSLLASSSASTARYSRFRDDYSSNKRTIVGCNNTIFFVLSSFCLQGTVRHCRHQSTKTATQARARSPPRWPRSMTRFKVRAVQRSPLPRPAPNAPPWSAAICPIMPAPPCGRWSKRGRAGWQQLPGAYPAPFIRPFVQFGRSTARMRLPCWPIVGGRSRQNASAAPIGASTSTGSWPCSRPSGRWNASLWGQRSARDPKPQGAGVRSIRLPGAAGDTIVHDPEGSLPAAILVEAASAPGVDSRFPRRSPNRPRPAGLRHR